MWVCACDPLLFSSLGVCQVWAVGEDRGLYFRMGVTPSEPSGNGWIPVSAQWGNSTEPVPPRSVRVLELFLEVKVMKPTCLRPPFSLLCPYVFVV